MAFFAKSWVIAYIHAGKETVMKYKRQMIFGLLASLFAWAVFAAADFTEEIILHRGLSLTALYLKVMPFVMLVCYIRHYLKEKPAGKKLAVWYGSYTVTYLVLWYVIFYLKDMDLFIPQRHQSGHIDLNGVEYTFAGFSTLFLFLGLCLLFHLFYFLTHRKRK